MRIIDVAKVGDYVLYATNRAGFSVTADESGSNFNQYFNPSSLFCWKVFKNDGENLEIIPCCNIPNLMLSGARGYMNSISILNGLASAFVNTHFAESARNLGSRGAQPQMITDSCVIESVDCIQEFDAIGDDVAEEDAKILTDNSLIPVKNFGIWAAKRGNGIIRSSHGFGVYVMNRNGKLELIPLYCYLADNKNYSTFSCSPICPIVKLKKDVLVKSGDGTSKKPYVLTI